MTTMRWFIAYFEAFEATYLDDDWSRLEPLFDPDAVYRVEGSGLYDCELRGRAAILAGLRKFIAGFDRHCERRLEAIGVPVVEGESIRFRGAAYYRRGGSPELAIELEERIEFAAGRIVRMTDTYPHGLAERSAEWIAAWGPDLELSYC